MPAFQRIAIDIIIAEEALLRWLIVAPGEADDDDMDMGLAARIRPPGEGAVGKSDFEVIAIKEQRPELRYLFALRDRIGGDKADAGPMPVVIVSGAKQSRTVIGLGGRLDCRVGFASSQ